MFRWYKVVTFLVVFVCVHVRSAAPPDVTSDADDEVDSEIVDPDAQDGRCTNCRNQKIADELFDHLAYAIKYNERMSYLALDMTWLDRILDSKARVHISYHDFSKGALESASQLLDDVHMKSLSFFHDHTEIKGDNESIPVHSLSFLNHFSYPICFPFLNLFDRFLTLLHSLCHKTYQI